MLHRDRMLDPRLLQFRNKFVQSKTGVGRNWPGFCSKTWDCQELASLTTLVGPGLKKWAVPGRTLGLDRSDKDKNDLVAFLMIL
jgi:hypothetical protein